MWGTFCSSSRCSTASLRWDVGDKLGVRLSSTGTIPSTDVLVEVEATL